MGAGIDPVGYKGFLVGIKSKWAFREEETAVENAGHINQLQIARYRNCIR